METRAVLLESKSSPFNLLHEMHQLRLLGHLCDVTVRVEHQGARGEFLAHKAVLAATSKYFKEVFLNDGHVLGGSKADVLLNEVLLNEVQVVDFASFLEFVYTAKVEVEEHRVQRMFEIAEKLKCLDLTETCFQLKKQMLETVLLELQNFSESQEEAKGHGGAQEANVIFDLEAHIEDPAPSDPLGSVSRVSPNKSTEKSSAVLETMKPSFAKIRRASGRLAGRKVFVEIPKKKYTRRLREQQKDAEDNCRENMLKNDPKAHLRQDDNQSERLFKSDEEQSDSNEELDKSLTKPEDEKKKDGNFKCGTCNKEFLYEKSFLKHNKNRHGVLTEVVYRCDTCTQTFANRCNLRSHQRHVHSSERRFPCELCGKKFKRKKDIKRHILQVHEGGGERHFCQVCGKGLSSKTALRLHERTHTGDRPYGCTQCEARFSQPSALKTHMRIHTGEKPFSCEECGARFTQNHILIYHRRCHTGERPFMCETCGKSFASKEYLKHHDRIHTGSKPFKCETCYRTFAQRNSLHQHLKVHTGERPYCCDQCGKQFTQQNALQRHHRIHTGEKPFMCSACRRTFTDKSTLRRHTSIHDKKTPWKSFLVVVDCTSKSDVLHKMEHLEEDYDGLPTPSEKMLPLSKECHYQNLVAVPAEETEMNEDNSTSDVNNKSDSALIHQEILIATTLNELAVLHTRTDSIQPQTPAVVNME
ncbi:GDNF-inducible zinc finger protein 1 isoform X2 [Ambystoma mexicanum]